MAASLSEHYRRLCTIAFELCNPEDALGSEAGVAAESHSIEDIINSIKESN